MQKKIEGIVISEVDFMESSKIINVFTKSGIIGIIARGAKRIKSKYFNCTAPLCYGNFYISYKINGLSNLTEVDIIDNFMNIRSDIMKMSYALYLLDLSKQVYKNENNPNIYNELISSISLINKGLDYHIITNILEYKYLKYLGINPMVDKCVVCGEEVVTISSYAGGGLCVNHAKQEKIINKKTIRYLQMFSYIDIKNIDKIEISGIIKKEINDFLEDYYNRYSGLYLKSREFIKMVERKENEQL